MNDTTKDKGKPGGSFGDLIDLATDDIGFVIGLPIIAGWIGCIVLVSAGTVLFYPLAWLLGFTPRRWWVKKDNFHWSHFLRDVAIAMFLVALAASCVIVAFTKYH